MVTESNLNIIKNHNSGIYFTINLIDGPMFGASEDQLQLILQKIYPTLSQFVVFVFDLLKFYVILSNCDNGHGHLPSALNCHFPSGLFLSYLNVIFTSSRVIPCPRRLTGSSKSAVTVTLPLLVLYSNLSVFSSDKEGKPSGIEGMEPSGTIF